MKIVYILVMILISQPLTDSFYHQNILNNDHDAFTVSNNFTSHFSTSKNNSNWFVLKFYLSSRVNVSELHLKFFYECKNIRVEWCGYIITNLTYSMRGGIISEFLNKNDTFLHFQIGSFNYTYNRLIRYNVSVSGAEIWKRNFTLSQGIWYLICFAGETIKSRIEVDFNATSNVKLIGMEEGNGTHILLPEDFWGNLNIKLGYYGILVLNGRKSIYINNTFIGIHYSMFEYNCQGFEDFQYITPSNKKGGFTIFSIFNHKIVLKDFKHTVIIGKNGKWDFILNLFMLGKRLPSGEYFSPGFGVGLVYADVKLP